ncbi:MAG: undecaprenyl-diphosphate phosphatase [Rhizomicrobium sp.]
MSDIFNSILLGIVEGLTEFLPVSSTAHLLVSENFLGLNKEQWEVFTVVIQFGAVLSVVAVYWRRFWDVLVGLPSRPPARQFALNVIVAFLPSAVLGVAMIKVINGFLLDPQRALPVIAASWIVGGIVILLFERIAPAPRYMDSDSLPLSKAFQIGLCQCLALLPGVSRSGATILGGELLGVDRKAAAQFTFYLAVPTMLGASVFELYKQRHALTGANLEIIAIGFVVSFLVAWVVVKAFIGFISRYGLKPFGWYRIAAGLALIAVLTLR